MCKSHDSKRMMLGVAHMGQGRMTLAGEIWQKYPSKGNRCPKA